MSQSTMDFPIIGYACGFGAGNQGCADGPSYLLEKEFVKNIQLLQPKFFEDKYQIVAEHCTALAKLTAQFTRDKKFFTVIGGDHTCAIGTWSGVSNAIRTKGDLGLIWIDAHLDAHTPQTTPSGNIHGMPVAALLGYGHSSLIEILDRHPKIKPENFCFIGARSYEADEHALIKKLNVRTFYMPEIQKLGFEEVFKQALLHVNKNTAGYGISLDLDAIDPIEAPGVGSPEKNGLIKEDVCRVLGAHLKECAQNSRLCGFEIAEYNPHRDKDNLTAKIVHDLLQNY